MLRRTPHLPSPRTSAALALSALAALLAIAFAAMPADAARPYTGAPVVYVGLEDEIAPEEGFVGMKPVGLRSIRLGQPRKKERVLTRDPRDSNPASSRDGRLIAFSGRGGLSIMRSDGSGQRRLTDGGGENSGDGEPAFSPSGRRVLFVREENETVPGSDQGDIYSIRTDGSGLRQITSGRSADSSPVLSPNGRQVVFAREPFGRDPDSAPEWGHRHIYSVRPNGSGLRDLTPRIRARSRRGERNFDAEDPTFNPNGRTIAFTVSANGGEDVYTMRPNGRRLRSLTGVGDRPLSRNVGLSEPAFSPSGRFLLVTARDRYRRTELALIDLADRSRLRTTGGLQGEAPAWVP